MRSGPRWVSIPGLGRRACLSLGLTAVTAACGVSHPFTPDCQALADAPWQVGRGDALDLAAGDSSQQSVTPGLDPACGSDLRSVTWSVEDPGVATVTALGPRNNANDTGGAIARAWITGVAPGVTVVSARVAFADGSREARPMAVRVSAATPPSGSFIVAEGSATVTFNQFTGGGGSEMIPIVMPRPGRADVTADWTSLGNQITYTVWEGVCAASPCPGLVLDAQLGSAKPQRRSFNAAAGEYTLRVGGVGSGQETIRYEVRLTPD